VAEELEIAAHGVTAILGTWLGLTVAIRARRLPAARVFGLICLFLVSWSVAIIVQRFSPEAAVDRVANGFEEMGAFLVIAATPHIAATLSAEGPWTRLQRNVVAAGYLLAIGMGLPAVVNPAAKFAITPPHFELPGMPGEVFGWAWILVRIGLFGFALGWLILALRGADRDVARQRQLHVALVTVGLGALGGTLRFTPPFSDSDPWLGVALVTASIVTAAYAVFAQRIFFSADVAARTFRTAVAAGLLVTGFVIVVVVLDRQVRDVLAVELPIVTTIALIATIALFEPLSERIRGWVSGRVTTDSREIAYERMLRALGDPLLSNPEPTLAVEPALARLSRAFRLSGARVTDAGGDLWASHGDFDVASPLALRHSLEVGGVAYGEVVFGPKRTGLPYATDEAEVLGQAATYLAGTLHLAATQRRQAAELESLTGQRRELANTRSELQAAIVGAGAGAASGLNVFALGPLRVERGDTSIRQWGGAKAGTRQAEALFAFLFDRGERGVAKDEIIELVWPDVDLERADLAFHRTLGGLRTTLEPGRPGGDRGTAIVFHNDRYRLDTSLVAWSDVEGFEEEMAAAGATADPAAALRHLERARSLYRGDYLDDCPFYGDSAQVEERRELLRGRFVDLLLTLGERYESRGDRPAAASCFRQARLVNGDDLPPADEALSRLGLAPS
jgi:DNA-binding SARP family transcriptional activator